MGKGEVRPRAGEREGKTDESSKRKIKLLSTPLPGICHKQVIVNDKNGTPGLHWAFPTCHPTELPNLFQKVTLLVPLTEISRDIKGNISDLPEVLAA